MKAGAAASETCSPSPFQKEVIAIQHQIWRNIADQIAAAKGFKITAFDLVYEIVPSKSENEFTIIYRPKIISASGAQLELRERWKDIYNNYVYDDVVLIISGDKVKKFGPDGRHLWTECQSRIRTWFDESINHGRRFVLRNPSTSIDIDTAGDRVIESYIQALIKISYKL
jgi:hypothetical protein